MRIVRVLIESFSSPDLLELSDNDEFLWGATENRQYNQVKSNNDTDNDGVSNFLSRHRLNKRQASAETAAPMLVSIWKLRLDNL